MLSRKDVRPRQTALLLQRGLLPVSIDYRLCPETTLEQGPMSDVCDALAWLQKRLPHANTIRQDIKIDTDRIVAIGWSTGGTLAMSLAWTPLLQPSLKAPMVVLGFYCPTDYLDQCKFIFAFFMLEDVLIALGWSSENFPFQSKDAAASLEDDDLLEGVTETPVGVDRLPHRLPLCHESNTCAFADDGLQCVL